MEIRKAALFVAATLVLASCGKSDKEFAVEGTMTDLKGHTLYLEHTALKTTEVLDSLVLTDKGDYSFRAPRPEYPDFYRLRVATSAIPFAVDSNETLTINSQKADFATNYKVENASSTEKMRQLRLSSLKIANQLTDTTLVRNDETQARFVEAVEAHKALSRQLILENIASPAAYFAITQMVSGYYYFSPANDEDLKYWRAVATSYQRFYPEYDRTKQIVDIVLQTQKNKQQADFRLPDVAEAQKVGMIDIVLPNRSGETTKLSSLVEKHVVLVDFSAYGMEKSAQYTLFLRGLYSRFHDKGMEIYQVSLDRDKVLWMEQSRKTPWVCVRDAAAEQSRYIQTFTIDALPTLFLIDRQGDLVGRYTPENVEAAIAKLLP